MTLSFSPLRRVRTGSACATIAISLTAFSGSFAPEPPEVDPAARAILDSAEHKIASLERVTADYLSIATYPKSAPDTTRAHIAFSRPKSARIDLTQKVTQFSQAGKRELMQRSTIQWDGTNVYTITRGDSAAADWYFSLPAGEDAEQLENAGPLAGFFALDRWRPITAGLWHSSRLNAWGLRSLKSVGTEEWEGKTYRVIQWEYVRSFSYAEDVMPYTTRMYIGDDQFVHRILTTTTKGYRTEQILSNIAVNPGLPDSTFALALPSNSYPQKHMDGSQLLQVGTSAPLFALPSTGGHLALSDALRSSKGVLLFFWAYS
jgi:outer membrane lipoprotein-sorting protein